MAATEQTVTIGDLRPQHGPEVARIYADGHCHRQSRRRRRAGNDGAVVGWAAVSPVSDRCVYGGVVENSVYIDESARGQVSDAPCSSG